MASRDAILSFADEVLDVSSYPDYGPVGLQVEGAAEVTKIVCGVSASRELFERAAAAGAEMVLVHHGLFWDRDTRVVGEVMRERLRPLFDHGITLAAYHLALDAHPELGNNANLARAVGVEAERRFADVGWGGRLREPVAIAALTDRIRDAVGREPLVFAYGPDPVERMAICSGGAARHLADAIDEGYDCFLTGEAAEPTMHMAKEAGVHFVAGGHYATETSGVQALAARVADAFAIQWEFVDLPNPV